MDYCPGYNNNKLTGMERFASRLLLLLTRSEDTAAHKLYDGR